MKTCIVHSQEGSYSETFIRNHVEHLPGDIRPLYGLDLDLFLPGGASLAGKPTLACRLVDSFKSRVLGIGYRSIRARRVAQYLAKEKVDIVLAEFGVNGVEIMDVCVQCSVPLVVHFHGYDAYAATVLEGAIGRAYRRLFGVAAAVVAVSRDMEAQLISLGAPAERVHYIPYGVDCERFRQCEVATQPPVFVSVGRFVDKKAPYLTLLAFAKCVQRVPESRLVMLGDGPLWEACQRLAVALGCGDAVEFPGVLTPARVAEKMQSARAFVQHSVRPRTGLAKGDSEGTPLAVIEAGASGLPIVATRHAGIKDVVIEGITGILVDEGDVEGMAEGMIQMARDPALAAQYGEKASQRVREEFEISKQLGKLGALLASVVRDGEADG
jgi:glycosyltransferase involved in cell wall biosynthesis